MRGRVNAIRTFKGLVADLRDYNKYFVIGLVHENRGRIASGLIPNHYVQLLGFNNKNYASFWTWGEENPRNSDVFGTTHGIHQIYLIKR